MKADSPMSENTIQYWNLQKVSILLRNVANVIRQSSCGKSIDIQFKSIDVFGINFRSLFAVCLQNWKQLSTAAVKTRICVTAMVHKCESGRRDVSVNSVALSCVFARWTICGITYISHCLLSLSLFLFLHVHETFPIFFFVVVGQIPTVRIQAFNPMTTKTFVQLILCVSHFFHLRWITTELWQSSSKTKPE